VGQCRACAASSARRRGNTEVTVDLTFATGTGLARVTYDADAKVVGVWIG
jgi:3,4-dihydroxy-2-butanone 4-phosphate synthase